MERPTLKFLLRPRELRALYSQSPNLQPGLSQAGVSANSSRQQVRCLEQVVKGFEGFSTNSPQHIGSRKRWDARDKIQRATLRICIAYIHVYI